MPDTFDQLRGTLRQQPRRRTARLQSENRALREAIGFAWPDATFIGTSAAATALRAEIDVAAQADTAVLLSGERGAGKGLVARLIHRGSFRFGEPLVAVSCTAMPSRLVGPELFGFERRDRYGRTIRRLGRLELAHGGTVLIDALDALPLDLQPRLLSFVRHGVVHRIGSARRILVDVRLIASTSGDLEALSAARLFNARLLARFRHASIRIAPLRERWEDISTIADAFLVELGRRSGLAVTLDEAARKSLLRHPWRGNVRELQDVLVRASHLCAGGRIGTADLPSEVVNVADGHTSSVPLLPSGASLRDIERLAITKTLEACAGNRAKTARQLGLSKKGFYLKMKRLGLWSSAR